MGHFLPLAVLASAVLMMLGIHIFRDVRGKARNRRGACYSCGKSESALRAVSSRYGATYLYCSRCADRQALFMGVAGSIAALAGAATMAAKSLSIVEANVTGSALLAGGALLIVSLVLYGAVRYVSNRHHASA